MASVKIILEEDDAINLRAMLRRVRPNKHMVETRDEIVEFLDRQLGEIISERIGA